jgi:hypothetical protein
MGECYLSVCERDYSSQIAALALLFCEQAPHLAVMSICSMRQHVHGFLHDVSFKRRSSGCRVEGLPGRWALLDGSQLRGIEENGIALGLQGCLGAGGGRGGREQVRNSSGLLSLMPLCMCMLHDTCPCLPEPHLRRVPILQQGHGDQLRNGGLLGL